MNLGVALIVLGMVVAVVFHWTLGVLLIVVGAVLMFAPAMR